MWRFFLQDVVPNLKACAHHCCLDFDVSDMRFCNTREERLQPELIKFGFASDCNISGRDSGYVLYLQSPVR